MKRLILLIVLPLCSLAALAQSRYTLQECVDVALASNHDLLYQSHVSAYDSVLMRSAFGAYLPSVSASAGYSRSLQGASTNQIISLNQLSFGLNANWLLYDGGSRSANYDNASVAARVTDLRTEYLKKQLRLQVYTQFVDVLRLQEIIKARQEDIAASTSQLDNFRARYDAGVIAVEAVLSQEAELGSKEIALLQQQIDLNTAKQALLITMGQNPMSAAEFADASIPTDITDQHVSTFRSEVGTVDTAIVTAFGNRIDYTAAAASQDMARTTLSGTTGNYYPTLSANFNYGYSGWDAWTTDQLAGSVGLNLNVPLFNNYQTDLAVQQSALALEQETTSLLKLQQSINAEVQTAYFNLESSEKAVQIARKSLAAASQNYRGISAKMDVGGATITEYITANSQFVTAQINTITSIFAYLNAQQNLLFTIGK